MARKQKGKKFKKFGFVFLEGWMGAFWKVLKGGRKRVLETSQGSGRGAFARAHRWECMRGPNSGSKVATRQKSAPPP